MRILLVDGKADPTSAFVSDLVANGFTVEITNTGIDALDLLRHYAFDLVLVQFVLPDTDGITFLTRMRTAGHNAPVLALNSAAQARYRTKALAAGADDVVEQGTDRDELIARMRAIVRRTRGHGQSRLQVGALALDIDQQMVTANGQHVHFTAKEFALLQLLMLRKNMVMTKDAILTNLYGGMDEPDIKIIDVFVCKIRNKLAKVGIADAISTVWGRGYTVRDQARGDFDVAQPSLPREVGRHADAYA
jgi:two-component system cell cycle response regulator CtrA